MNNKLMKLVAITLVIFMLPLYSVFAESVPDFPPSESTENQTPESGEASTPEQDSNQVVLTPENYRDTIMGYYAANTTLTNWWDVVALYGVGADLSGYTLPEWTDQSLGETATVTDYAGIIFGLIAAGQNVHNIWGRDIADELAKMQDVQTGLFGTYPNQQIYAILALDAAKEPYDREAAISALISTFRTPEGAFGYLPLDPDAEPVATPDIDITAMALLVLDQPAYTDTISSAVTYLAGQQLENGGFASWGTENANTLESVISALATLNLLDDSRFIKNDRPLSDVLSSYISEDGMLAWEAGSTEANLLATQQGLIAYGDIIAGKSVFLRLSSTKVCSTATANVRIEGSAETLLNASVTLKGCDLNLIDAIKAVLDANSISYIIEDSEHGAYIKSINSETAGKFGGWDGWLVTLNGIELSGSADTYLLANGDSILVYYGMFSPGTLIPSYTLSTTSFKKNVSFTVTVTGTYFDYTTSQNVTLPVAGATVEVGGVKYTTDETGVATITPSSSGTKLVKIYKDNQNSYPSIVRIVPFDIEVAPSSSGGGGISSRPSTKDEPDKTEDAKEENKPEDESTSEPETKPESEPEQVPETELTYGDADKISGWAEAGVKTAVAAGLFKGDDKGNFNPSASLTRAQLAAILLRLTKSEEILSEDAGFTDITPDDWFYGAVCSVYKLGFMNGTGEAVFAPQQSVTREQAAVVLARILNLTSDKSSSYLDADKISGWAADSINALTETGIMEGSGGSFNPQGILTREMCAVIMSRAIAYMSAE